MKAILTVEVEFDPDVTDAESLASAADRLMKTAISTPDILDDYANPRFGEFLVAPNSETLQHPRPTVVVEVSDGVLQEAYATDSNVKLRLVDWDCDDLEPDSDNRIFAINSVDGPTRRATVTEFATVAMKQLSSDTRQALQRAGLEPEEPLEMCRRWVLYDMDSDALLRTTTYDSYEEAADDAARANDVLVLPLVISGITL